MRRAAIFLGLLLLLALVTFFGVAPRLIDARMNPVAGVDSPLVPAEAQALHRGLRIADLHNDFLLWSRDLKRRAARGHSDMPRLRQGNVRLQVFSSVIRTPRGQNYLSNPSDTDAMLPLVIAQRWPPATWTSDFARAEHQARRLHAQAGDGLVVLRSAADVNRLFAGDARPRALGAILAIEGMHALEGDARNLDRLFELGYRIFGLAHFFDNRLGGSAHGRAKGGLTPFGREIVAAIEERRGVIDLAHASPEMADDVLHVATRPVIVSHTGVQATCPGQRNLSDVQIRAIAATGGLIGIGFWPGATCELSVDAIARAIQHTVHIAGAESVALGSDFDGATRVPFDVSRLNQLTAALLDAGLSYDQVRAIMGENAIRLFQEVLPR